MERSHDGRNIADDGFAMMPHIIHSSRTVVQRLTKYVVLFQNFSTKYHSLIPRTHFMDLSNVRNVRCALFDRSIVRSSLFVVSVGSFVRSFVRSLLFVCWQQASYLFATHEVVDDVKSLAEHLSGFSPSCVVILLMTSRFCLCCPSVSTVLCPAHSCTFLVRKTTVPSISESR